MNAHKKSPISTMTDFLLIFIFVAAIPAVGVGIGNLTDRGSQMLNLQPWIWNVFWACAAVCLATGIYSKKWVHCFGLAMIFLAIGNLGFSGVVADVQGGFDPSQLAKETGVMLGLMLGVGIPVMSALLGLGFAYKARREGKNDDEDCKTG